MKKMEETDNICFVCDQTIPLEKWKYQLQVTATKRRNAPVADLIQELVGDEFEVLVGERDAICSKCMNLLNLMDSLTFQLGEVKSTLTQLLHAKYNLAGEETQLQVEYDDSTHEDREPLHKCEVCNYQTRYEKEFNMHLRTHPVPKKHRSPMSIKSEASKKVQPTRTKKKSPKKTQKRKSKHFMKPKEKKKKVVFQCGVCNEVFPNENEIRIHCKKDHGNDKIVVSDEEEYDDIQTLESSSDEEIISPKENLNKKPVKRRKDSSEAKLDFLDDWVEDDDNDDLHSPVKKLKSEKETVSTKQAIMKGLFRSSLRDSFDDADDNDVDEKDPSSQPTCVFCHAKFSSFEAVQDHVKLSHGDRPNLSLPKHKSQLHTDSSTTEASFEIDSTTDIAENNRKINAKKQKPKAKSYKCMRCGIKKVNLKFIKDHVKKHQRKLSLQCRKCGIIFKKIISLKVHTYKCHRVGSLLRKCRKCKFRFVSEVHLKSHFRKVHSKTCSKKQENVRNKRNSYGSLNTVSSDHSNSHHMTKNDTQFSTKIDSSKISVSEVSSTSIEKEVKKKQSSLNPTYTCTECNTSFPQQNRFLTHLMRHKAHTCNSLGICVFCEKLFMSTEHLVIHNKTIHEQLNVKPVCSVCKKKYTLLKDLKLHYLQNHFNENAESLVKRVSELKNKGVKMETKANVENDVYNKVFKELQDLTGEGNDSEASLVEENLSPLIYNCPICDFSSRDDDEVKTHLPSHVQHYCNICENIFRPEEVINHLENHSIDFQGLKCSVCDREYHDNIHFQSHIKIFHSDLKKNFPGHRFQCNMCEKSCLTEKLLLTHKATQHGKKTKKVLTCTECKTDFFTEKTYQNHVEFAHRSGLNCKYCDKSLQNVKKLIFHEKNHLKEIKSIIKCNICGKVLKSKQALKTHKNLHNSNKSFCDTCNVSFKSYHSLREHSAKHSDQQEKKYFCEICGKGFYYYDSHARHRRVHLDPLLFQCKTCKERFPTKLKLKEHKETCSKVS